MTCRAIMMGCPSPTIVQRRLNNRIQHGPTALNIQLVPPGSSSTGMGTVPFADWAANNARMAVEFPSKALPRTLTTTARSVTRCNRRQALVPYVPMAASAMDQHASLAPLPARRVLVRRRITASCVLMVNSYSAKAVFQAKAMAFVLAQA
jgi:hypothetical protein